MGLLSAFSAAAQVTVPGQASVPGAMAIPATSGRLNPAPGIVAPGQPGIPTVTGALPSGAVVPSTGAIYGNNSGRLNNNSDTRNDPTRTYSSTDPANPANSSLFNGTGTQNTGLLDNQGMLRPSARPATTPATRPTRRATTTTPVRSNTTPARTTTTVRP